MIKKLIILGNHIQALGLSRMAAKTGLEVTLFSDYNLSLTRFSNTCNTFIRFTDQKNLLEKLLSHSGPDKTALLIPTNDSLVWFLRENYQQLSVLYNLGIADPEVTEMCYNKKKTYKAALELDIPIPKSYFPEDENEMLLMIPEIKFPVILKPAVMHTFYKLTGKKVYKCHNQNELLFYYNKILQFIPAHEVIIQEFLVGGAKNLYSLGAFSAEGIVYGSLVANRIRQKPMDFGISTTFAKTIINERINQLGNKLLCDVKYFGLSEVEFMFDEKINDFKLIEINPRAWKWHSITNKLGVNLIEMMVNYLNGRPPEVFENKKENVAWVERVTDTFISFKEILKKRLTVKEFLKTRKLEKEYAVWSKKDPLPALMYLILIPYLFLKRN
ncbi:MAG: hypothetical protein JXJ22_15900 [Bacteroidales bacterium]|nr:hypothetical protein [Bacteroidales bacterium]